MQTDLTDSSETTPQPPTVHNSPWSSRLHRNLRARRAVASRRNGVLAAIFADLVIHLITNITPTRFCLGLPMRKSQPISRPVRLLHEEGLPRSAAVHRVLQLSGSHRFRFRALSHQTLVAPLQKASLISDACSHLFTSSAFRAGSASMSSAVQNLRSGPADRTSRIVRETG